MHDIDEKKSLFVKETGIQIIQSRKRLFLPRKRIAKSKNIGIKMIDYNGFFLCRKPIIFVWFMNICSSFLQFQLAQVHTCNFCENSKSIKDLKEQEWYITAGPTRAYWIFGSSGEDHIAPRVPILISWSECEAWGP